MDFILKAKKAKQNDEGIDDVDDEFGTTPLHMAVTASNLLTVEYLVEKGSDINYRHKSSCTPFFLAAAFVQDQKIIDLLLKNIKKMLNSTKWMHHLFSITSRLTRTD